MIVDAHTHSYPPSIRNDPTAFAQKQNEKHWLSLVSPSSSKSLQGWVSTDQMINDMEAAKVNKAVLLGWYWENPESCLLHNDWHAQCLQQFPDQFIGFASLHARLPNPVEELKIRMNQGFQGIGECHPWVQGSSLREKSWMKCMEFASTHHWPVTFHITEPVGHDYPGRVSTPFEDFLWLAREFPDLKIILAHAGGLFPFYELNPKIRPEVSNIYYDLAACPLLYELSLYRKIMDTVGAHKILWGTDYPLRIFPRTQKEPDMATFRDLIEEEAGLTHEEQAQVLGANLLSLLPC